MQVGVDTFFSFLFGFSKRQHTSSHTLTSTFSFFCLFFTVLNLFYSTLYHFLNIHSDDFLTEKFDQIKQNTSDETKEEKQFDGIFNNTIDKLNGESETRL
mmetsp:Transcript_26042/g.33839  ORF Transcript_26042/g.33839 Transcript_26042/m.33839 type:complete len:100 (+) Transcript_26042:558-857(+)